MLIEKSSFPSIYVLPAATAVSVAKTSQVWGVRDERNVL